MKITLTDKEINDRIVNIEKEIRLLVYMYNNYDNDNFKDIIDSLGEYSTILKNEVEERSLFTKVI